MASDNQDAILETTLNELEMAPIPHTATTPTIPATKHNDPYLVAFTDPYDPDNPLDWSTGRKWAVTDVLSATSFNRIMVSTIMAPALSTIAKDLDMTPAESAMALSIYLLATAFGPLLIGPMSEVYGREIVLHASSLWFLIWNIACGFANSKELLIGARFLAGFGASSIYALAGGVLSDVWRPEQRGRSLSIYLLIPLLGACVGPIIGGFMAERTTWRWMFWATSIFQAVMMIATVTTFKETYGPLILHRRAEKLRRETGHQRYHTEHEDLERDKTLLSTLGRAFSRPLRLLAFHPVIQITAVLEGFNYGLLYIVLSTFSTLWISHYGQSVEISGLHYIAISLGEVAGSQICGFFVDFFYRQRRARNPTGVETPESRLPIMVPGIIVGYLFLLFYGWTAENRVYWIAVDVAILISLMGIQCVSMISTAYIIDSYSGHTSSAMAATRFIESMCAFLFPLFSPRMYEVLGYGWANTTLCFIGLIIGLPYPWVLWKYGAKLRAKATSSY
ncbi:major facilitator superfamily domain-containing protein [Cadophora sp. MPI-SDFR-AT-0126]|nr:major facilitator superfamily domain-containing protein [Leotiomycetes sp. MPI-SDFR-AT-0126]